MSYPAWPSGVSASIAAPRYGRGTANASTSVCACGRSDAQRSLTAAVTALARTADQPAVGQEPRQVRLDGGQHVQVADPAQQRPGPGIRAAFHRRDERLQHDPVHVRAGGPQQMVLRVVEHRERVGAVRGPGAAQPPGETVQHVPLPVLERPHLPGPVEEHGLIVAAGPAASRRSITPRAAVRSMNATRELLGHEAHRGQRAEVREVALVVRQQALGHQLEQDGVVPLERGEHVGVGLQRGQQVLRQVARAPAGLTARLDGGGRVPVATALIPAARPRAPAPPFRPAGPSPAASPAALRALSPPPSALQLLRPASPRSGPQPGLERGDELVLREAEGVRGGQRREQGALVGAVIQQHHLALDPSGRLELPPDIAIADRDRQRAFRRAARRARHADPAADQRPDHGEEPAAITGDRAAVAAVLGDVAEPVKQRLAPPGAGCPTGHPGPRSVPPSAFPRMPPSGPPPGRPAQP